MLAKVQPEPSRYRISTLDVEDIHVWLMLMDGSEWVGKMRLTARGAQRFERFEGGRRYTKIDPEYVSMWRPIEPLRWPFPLPTPDGLTKEFRTPIPAPRKAADADLDDPAINPRIYLGRPHEAPASVLELEIRLIRALRTAAVQEWDPLRREIAWLKQLCDEITVITKTLETSGAKRLGNWTAEDENDYHIDRSELNARPARFEPTPRDISDYEAALDAGRRYRESRGLNDGSPAQLIWLELMWPKDRWMFHARAKLPPLSWWGIADHERVDEGAVKRRYREALERAYGRS